MRRKGEETKDEERKGLNRLKGTEKSEGKNTKCPKMLNIRAFKFIGIKK
jgi:hypothetical protein